FAITSLEKKLIPVRLLPGRARLATRPSLTGSSPTTKTIGIVAVAAFAAGAAALPRAAMTATRRRARSSARAGSRSISFSANWYEIDTFSPSTKPACPEQLLVLRYGREDPDHRHPRLLPSSTPHPSP